MQWFCHPALRQIQGLTFISLCSECSRLHGNHKVSTHAAGLCLSHRLYSRLPRNLSD